MGLSHDEIAEIVKIIDSSWCEELIVETGDVKLVVRRNRDGAQVPARTSVQPVAAVAAPAAVAPAAQPSAATPPAVAAASHQIAVAAPMVGTFYRAPSPDAAPFVEIGSAVRKGQPLCLIEVMKLFTTIACRACTAGSFRSAPRIRSSSNMAARSSSSSRREKGPAWHGLGLCALGRRPLRPHALSKGIHCATHFNTISSSDENSAFSNARLCSSEEPSRMVNGGVRMSATRLIAIRPSIFRRGAGADSRGTLLATAAQAQEKYPEHPIKFIVPWGPGGGADLLARTAGKIMSRGSRRLAAGAQRAGRHRVQSGMTKLLNAPADGYSLAVLIGDTYRIAGRVASRLHGRPSHSAGDHDPAAVGLLGQHPEQMAQLGMNSPLPRKTRR